MANRLTILLTLLLVTGCGGGSTTTTGDETETPQAAPDPGLGTISLTDRDIQFLPARGFALGAVRLTPIATHSEHVLILGNLQQATAQVTLKTPTTTGPAKTIHAGFAADDPETPAGDRFHRFLRVAEADLMALQAPVPFPVKRQAIVNCPSIQTFRVLASLNSLQLTAEVTAAKVRETATSCTYLDPKAVVDPAILEKTLSDFDGRMVPEERRLFGEESDLNGDGKVTLLLTPAVNRLGTFAGGIISGFFFAGDLFPRTSSNPSSNEQEILYLAVPDPTGTFGPRLDTDFTLRKIVPAVLAHELQHMLNFTRHSERGTKRVEEAWLNEALSHLIEDIIGYGTDNFSRVSLCLKSIHTVPLLPQGPPNLAERGCGYLLVRYLYEQSGAGEPFLQRLVASDKTGIANVLEAVGRARTDFDQFSEIWARWQVAVTFSGTPAIHDPRFIFRPVANHPLTQLPTGICLRCSPDDGRRTELAGPAALEITSYPVTLVLPPLATQVLILSNPPATLDLEAAANVSLVGSLTPLN